MEEPVMCYLRYEPVNRRDKKILVSEAEKIITRLRQIEMNFYIQLFSENDSDYEMLYNFYLDRYINGSKWIENNLKLKNVVINKDYFHDKFKPEQYLSENNFTKFLLLLTNKLRERCVILE